MMRRNPNWKPVCKRGEIALLCDWAECGCRNTSMDVGFIFAKPNTDKKTKKQLPLKPTESQRAGYLLVCVKCGRYIKYPTQADFRKKERTPFSQKRADEYIIGKAKGMLNKKQMRHFDEAVDKLWSQCA